MGSSQSRPANQSLSPATLRGPADRRRRTVSAAVSSCDCFRVDTRCSPPWCSMSATLARAGPGAAKLPSRAVFSLGRGTLLTQAVGRRGCCRRHCQRQCDGGARANCGLAAGGHRAPLWTCPPARSSLLRALSRRQTGATRGAGPIRAERWRLSTTRRSSRVAAPCATSQPWLTAPRS